LPAAEVLASVSPTSQQQAKEETLGEEDDDRMHCLRSSTPGWEKSRVQHEDQKHQVMSEEQHVDEKQEIEAQGNQEAQERLVSPRQQQHGSEGERKEALRRRLGHLLVMSYASGALEDALGAEVQAQHEELVKTRVRELLVDAAENGFF
jgi:hypothetical protein